VGDAVVYEFSLPTKADKAPVGPDGIHEIKYDGYRMLLIRDQDRVRLIQHAVLFPSSFVALDLPPMSLEPTRSSSHH
jgi:hypothetical protein